MTTSAHAPLLVSFVSCVCLSLIGWGQHSLATSSLGWLVGRLRHLGRLSFVPLGGRGLKIKDCCFYMYMHMHCINDGSDIHT